MQVKVKNLLRLFFLSIIISVCSNSNNIQGSESVIEKIEKIVQAETKYDLFSGTVLVAKNGNIIYAKGIGYANKEYHIPNILETKFNIGSIEKCFVAAIIMQLNQEGKLDLKDTLSKYFPDCPYKTADKIQIKHLLNHTAGLGDYRRGNNYSELADTARCIDDVLLFVFQQEPESDPGEYFKYSNTGYLLLKAIIERVASKPFKNVLRHRILHPLGMYDTELFSKGDLLNNRASGYQYADNDYSYIRATGEPSAYSGGGIYSTVIDLLKFDQGLYMENLLTETSKKTMFTPDKLSNNYGYGWFVIPWGDGQAVFHGGSSDGFNAELRRYPDKGYTVIVLSNYQGDAAFELANKIDCMLFGYPYELATEFDLNARLGDYYMHRVKDYRIALSYFEKNLLDPDNIHLHSLYESACVRIKGRFDLQKAIENLDLYIELAGEQLSKMFLATIWARKGEAYELLGNKSKAVRCYEKIMTIDPNFPNLKKIIDRLNAQE